MREERWQGYFLWEKSQEVTIYGATCTIVEDYEGGVWILAPLARVAPRKSYEAPRKSYEAEDVPNARTRT